MTIQNKRDYKIYLEADKISLGQKGKRVPIICTRESQVIWKFQRLLRKVEYYSNCSNSYLGKTYGKFLKYLYFRKQVKLGFRIPVNVFGPGLSIAHIGTIIVNDSAKVGSNCRLHVDTNIGATGKDNEAANIGNDVFISVGTKIIGGIEIADDVMIGANSVVTKSINEQNISIVGAPAKKVSSEGNPYPRDKRGYDVVLK